MLGAAAVLAAVRVGLALRWIPLPTLQRALRRVLGRPGASERQVAWAITAVGSRFHSTCLTQALAGQALLPGTLVRIGVAREHTGAFRAHAWLERNGRVILGGATATGYAPLASLGS